MNFLIILTLLPLGISRTKDNWNNGDLLPRPDVDFGRVARLLRAQIYKY